MESETFVQSGTTPTTRKQAATWLEISKSRAFLSHLTLSACIVGIVILLVYFVWYPSPFFEATGTASVLRILIGVDLIVGPLLTAIVFKPGKPYLKLDLAIIAIVQLAALIYGVSVLFQERPYFMVFAVDRFHVLAHKDAVIEDPSDLAWIEKPWIGPIAVVASLPAGLAERQQLLEETVFQGKPDIDRRPRFWRPFEELKASVSARAANIDLIRSGAPGITSRLDDIVRRSGKQDSELGFLPVIAKKGDVTAIVDRAGGTIVGVLEVSPWQLL